jgi:hypothetical protein
MTKQLEFGQNIFIPSSGTIQDMINLIFTHGFNFGLLFLFVPIGVVTVFFYKINNNKQIIIPFLSVGIIFLWPDFIYFVLILTIFISIYGGFGIYKVYSLLKSMKPKSTYLLPVFFSTLLFILIIMPQFVNVQEADSLFEEYPTISQVSEETYNSAIYIDYTTEGKLVSNYGTITSKINAFTNRNSPSIPFYFDAEHLELNSLQEILSGNLREIYVTSDQENEGYDEIKYSVIGNFKGYNNSDILEALQYNLGEEETEYIVIIMDFIGPNYINLGRDREFDFLKPSIFLITITNDFYMMYNDGFELIYEVNYENIPLTN